MGSPPFLRMHGAFDDYRSWVDKGAAENASEPYQMIVVMPDGGTFGWYANHVNNGPRWESFHIGELIPWVDATFRTKPQRSERAIAGLSMGGHGTAAYSGRHPDLFAAAELVYMTYHLDWTVFLFAHTIAEVLDLTAFVLVFAAAVWQTVGARRPAAELSR